MDGVTMLPGDFIGEVNGQLVCPPNFHRYAPDVQVKLIEMLQERWRGERSKPATTARLKQRRGVLAEAKRRGWRVVK